MCEFYKILHFIKLFETDYIYKYINQHVAIDLYY